MPPLKARFLLIIKIPCASVFKSALSVNSASLGARVFVLVELFIAFRFSSGVERFYVCNFHSCAHSNYSYREERLGFS